MGLLRFLYTDFIIFLGTRREIYGIFPQESYCWQKFLTFCVWVMIEFEGDEANL